MPEKKTGFQFRIEPNLAKKIEERAVMLDSTKQALINKDLSIYYNILDGSLKNLQFNEAELCLILDTCNSLLFDSIAFKHLDLEVADAIELEGLGEKWGVDKDSILTKLHQLSLGEKAALADAIERWRQYSPAERENIAETLKKIGFVVK